MTEVEVAGVLYVTKPYDEMPYMFMSMQYSEAYGTLEQGIRIYREQCSEWPTEIYELERPRLGNKELLPAMIKVWHIGNALHEPWVRFDTIEELALSLAEVE